jgi:peptide/nickel transport system substrate-binding protein
MRAAAAAALAGGLLAACGGSGGAPAASTAVGTRSFVDLVGELPTDLDETGTPSPAAAQTLPSWSSELVRPAPATPGPGATLAPDDAVVPYLATSWQRSAGGSYTFELRRGVRGATGDPFTAADVRWSLDRALARSPDAPFLFALAHIDTADPVSVIDSHRVRVNVTSPSPFTLSVLASYDVGIYDSALYRAHASAGDPWGQQWGATHSASFGAYSVALFLPRSEIDLVANPGFWRPPYYTHVFIRQLASSSERLSALLGGSATHTSGLAWKDFETAVDNGHASSVTATILQTGPAVLAWHLNIAHGPLANPLVRQAITLGINRGEIANGLNGGFYQPSELTIPAAFGQAQPTTFDPQQSRSLMRAAGYAPGITLNLYTNGSELGSSGSSILNVVYNDMLQIGVVLNITYLDDTDQLLALEHNPGLESYVNTDTPLLGAAGFLLEQDANAQLDPFSPAAEQHYASASLQTLADQLGSSPGGAATQTLIGQTAAAIDTATPTVNLLAIPVQNVTRSGITGYGAYTQPVTYYEYLHPGS